MTVRRVLVCTSQFAAWAGAEVVAAEMVEAFAERGASVDLLCHLFDEDLAAAVGPGVTVIDAAEAVDPNTYDVIYNQHRVASLIAPRLSADSPGGGPFIAYGHLSPFDPNETPSPLVEPLLADLVLCNSAETRAALAELEPRYADATLWRNPAPVDFEHAAAGPTGPTLRRLLIVSNHALPELRAAVRGLERRGVRVTRIGREGARRRVTASDLRDCDAVATIGKTVQYALASRRPVFCFGPFGGPGWLGPDNFDIAASLNFSGRSHPTMIDAAELEARLMDGYPAAAQFVAGLDDVTLSPFLLKHRMDWLMATIAEAAASPARAEARQKLLKDAAFRGHLALEERLVRLHRDESLRRRRKRPIRRLLSALRRIRRRDA